METTAPAYTMKKSVPAPFEETERRVREQLQQEGFGILTEIDVRSTLREKLGVEFRPYKILGACNPELAHQALSRETDIGVLLPCNVIVYRGEDPDTTEVAAAEPTIQLGVAGRQDLEPLAREVRSRLERALDRL